jgi:hypothetical protein
MEHGFTIAAFWLDWLGNHGSDSPTRPSHRSLHHRLEAVDEVIVLPLRE